MDKSTIKERVLNYGCDTITSIEKISLLTGIEAHNLSQYKTILEIRNNVDTLECTDLQRCKLDLIFKIFEEYAVSRCGERITNPKDVYNLMHPRIGHMQQEVFIVILLNAKSRIISVVEVSSGSLSSSIVHPREVFKCAIQKSAHSILAVHNHPSLDTTPSKEDITITKRLKEAGEIIGIPLLDHIIIGESYCSLKEQSYL